MGRERRRDVYCLLILALLAVGFLWPVTLGGKVMLPGDLLLLADPWAAHAGEFPEFKRVGNPILDAVNQFYPWRAYARERLLRNTLPLWNPHQFCGTPFIANNSSGIFYPETWLHCLMPSERALGWASALFLFLAGAFMFGFLRTIGCRPVAGLFGAIAFMANGFFVGWLCFPSVRSVFAWLPLILMAFERAIRTCNPAWAAVAAVGIAMQFLAGFLHVSLYLLIIVGLYALWRIIALWRAGEAARARWALTAFAAAALVGGCLASCQLLPTLEGAQMTERVSSYDRQLTYRLPSSFLALGMIPDLFGNPVDYNHWGQHVPEVLRTYTETAWYVGAGTWLLAIAALALRRRGHVWFWLGIFALAWLLALGSGLNAVLYYLVPGYKWLAGIGRAISMAATALPVLGALGLEALLAELDKGRRRQMVVVACAATGGLLLVGLLAWLLTNSFIVQNQLDTVLAGVIPYTARQALKFGALVVGAGVVLFLCATRLRRVALVALLGIIALDMYLFLHHFTPATNPAYLHIGTTTIPELRSGDQPHRFLSLGRDAIRRLPANQAMRLGLEDIQGSDSLLIGRYRHLLTTASGQFLGFEQPDWRLPLMDLLGVRDVICRAPLPETKGLRLLDGPYEVNIYRNEEALPRAYVPARVRAVATPAKALELVTSTELEPRNEVVITSDPGTYRAQSPVELTIGDYEINRFAIVSEQPWSGLTVVANAYCPGWHAFAEGHELTVRSVDYALTGVEVANTKRVDMVYLPASFTAGGFLTCVAAALLAGMIVAARRRHDD